MKQLILPALFAVLLPACATADFSNASDAVLTNNSADVRAEIAAAISTALGGAPVSLSPDSLTLNSRVIIERREAMGPDGNPIMGRRFDKPDHFILKISGSKCALLHEQTGEYHGLELAECEPVL